MPEPPAERWLFPGNRHGKPMTTRQLRRLFHEAADAAGIKKAVTLHALRHNSERPIIPSEVLEGAKIQAIHEV
jgi:site-specific recombinase XerD